MATKVDFVEVGRRAHELANRHRRNAYQYVARLAAQALERLMRPIFGRLLGRPTISLSPNLEELHLRCEEKERMTEFEALERIGLVCPKRCQYFRRSFLVAFRIIISQYSMTRRSSGLFLVSMRAAFEELE